MKKPDTAWIPDFVREWAESEPDHDVAKWIAAQTATPGPLGPSPEQCMIALYPFASAMIAIGGESMKIKAGNVVAIIARKESGEEIDAIYEQWSATRENQKKPAKRSKKP
jgi:hypothetical protein